MNKMIVIGNLVRDPEVRTMNDGGLVCNFTVATNRRLRSGEQEASFTRISVWGNQADACGKYLTKGSKVCCIGRPTARGYTANDGSVHAEINITATEVEFLHTARQSNDEFTEVDDGDVPFSE